MILLDEALAFGLRFDFSPDGELAMLRGHARNAAIVIRRELQAALAPGAGPAARGERLRRAGALAGDLTGTIGQIQWRAQAAEAALPDDSWSATWAGRLLSLAAALLPRDRRRAFVEDQCGNLAHAASRREWAAYLVGLLVRMPSIAAALAGD